MSYEHIPVLLNEVLLQLNVKNGERYIDCTFGGGGYSQAVIERGGIVLGIDADEDAISNGSKKYSSLITAGKLILVKGNFDAVEEIAQKNGFVSAAGAVFDLGISSYQIDTPGRGFSFMKEGPLDMRMDKDLTVTAGKLLDILGEKSLAEIFMKFGDELHAKKIAIALVKKRNEHSGHYWETQTTTSLADFISNAVGGRKERIHPATRVFQALRMVVNDEAGSLERGLAGAFDSLGEGGNLVVVSFHSIEDRIAKSFIRNLVEKNLGDSAQDLILPTENEIAENPRSRSAKLRAVKKR